MKRARRLFVIPAVVAAVTVAVTFGTAAAPVVKASRFVLVNAVYNTGNPANTNIRDCREGGRRRGRRRLPDHAASVPLQDLRVGPREALVPERRDGDGLLGGCTRGPAPVA